jgi:PPOX class probable FMN-dependent enzyme
MAMKFPRWRQSLVRSLHVQRSKPESKFFQVANAYQKKNVKDEANNNAASSEHSTEKAFANIPSNSAITVENRTMVFRGFVDNSHTILAITDSRSDKVEQWQDNQQSQICWYFTKTREQYRISAIVSLLNGYPSQSQIDFDNMSGDVTNSIEERVEKNKALRADVWSRLSDKAKEQFFWPDPKQEVGHDDEKHAKMKNDADEIPRNFTLVCFHPYYVDYLNLSTSPQTREINECIDSIWTSNAVNP